MRASSLGLAAILLTMAGSGPAWAAEQLAITLQGTIDEISDAGGVLGSADAGDAFKLVYTADFSKGLFGGGGGGFGGEVYLIGGSSEAPDANAPTLQISPISATLYIDNHSLYFPGAYLGSIAYVRNSFDITLGGNGESWANITAQDQAIDGSLSDNISSSVNSDTLQTFGNVSVKDPVSVAIDGVHVTGLSTFSYTTSNAGHNIGISGTLKPTFYSATISAVPEPLSWALMIVGFGMIGVGLRYRRHYLPYALSEAR